MRHSTFLGAKAIAERGTGRSKTKLERDLIRSVSSANLHSSGQTISDIFCDLAGADNQVDRA